MEKITAIITNYNKSEYVKSAIESVLACSNIIYELVIVDDNSTDFSVDIINESIKNSSLKTILIKNKNNLGAAAGRNVGIDNSSGDLLLFIDADIKFDRNCIIKLIDGTKGFDISYPKILQDDNSVYSPMDKWSERHITNSSIFLIRKNSIKIMDSYFDELMYIYSEDFDFFFRAHAFGLKSNYIKDATAYHPLRKTLSEEVFYYKFRNSIYFYLKLHGIIKYKYSSDIYIIYILVNYFISAVLRNMCAKLIPTKTHFSGSLFMLIALYFKAILWNISTYNSISKKRTMLIKSLLQQGKTI